MQLFTSPYHLPSTLNITQMFKIPYCPMENSFKLFIRVLPHFRILNFGCYIFQACLESWDKLNFKKQCPLKLLNIRIASQANLYYKRKVTWVRVQKIKGVRVFQNANFLAFQNTNFFLVNRLGMKHKIALEMRWANVMQVI